MQLIPIPGRPDLELVANGSINVHGRVFTTYTATDQMFEHDETRDRWYRVVETKNEP